LSAVTNIFERVHFKNVFLDILEMSLDILEMSSFKYIIQKRLKLCYYRCVRNLSYIVSPILDNSSHDHTQSWVSCKKLQWLHTKVVNDDDKQWQSNHNGPSHGRKIGFWPVLSARLKTMSRTSHRAGHFYANLCAGHFYANRWQLFS